MLEGGDFGVVASGVEVDALAEDAWVWAGRGEDAADSGIWAGEADCLFGEIERALHEALVGCSRVVGVGHEGEDSESNSGSIGGGGESRRRRGAGAAGRRG